MHSQATLAQSVEHRIRNAKVDSPSLSSGSQGTVNPVPFFVVQWIFRLGLGLGKGPKIAAEFQTDAAVGYRLQDDLEIQDSVTAEEGGEPDGAMLCINVPNKCWNGWDWRNA